VNKSSIGSLAIIIGGLVLSLELYGLKIVQGLEMQKGSWRTHAIDYAADTPISLALGITIAVIVYGVVLVTESIKANK
jgi:hypothetical protein